MAKVIEFYIPRNFTKRRKPFPQVQLGKVIEFSVRPKKCDLVFQTFCAQIELSTLVPRWSQS